jgi:hypothetical protein
MLIMHKRHDYEISVKKEEIIFGHGKSFCSLTFKTDTVYINVGKFVETSQKFKLFVIFGF